MQGQGPCSIMRIVVDGACNFWTAWVQRLSGLQKIPGTTKIGGFSVQPALRQLVSGWNDNLPVVQFLQDSSPNRHAAMQGSRSNK